MNAITPSSKIDGNRALLDDEKILQNDPLVRTFQNAAPPSGFWRLWQSVTSYFSSRQVVQVREPAAPPPETPQQRETRLEIEKMGALRFEHQKQIEEVQARLDFPPYQLVIEFPEGERIYSVHSQNEEMRIINELKEWVNKNFQSLKIVSGVYGEDLCKILKGQNAKTRKTFTEHFNLHEREGEIYEWLGPKPIAEEVTGVDLRRVRYSNGIEEEERLFGDKWKTESRRYPNGDFEKGKFKQGLLDIGTRCFKGEYEFLYPENLGNGPILLAGKWYEFSKVEIDGEKRSALLEKKGGIFRFSKAPPLPILFHGVKSCYSSLLIENILKLPLPSISPREIVEYIFASEANGEPRIFSLQSQDVLALLKEAQKLGISFDFHKPSPVTNQTLFAKWVVNGELELLECMLTMDPACIEQTRNQEISFVRQCLNTEWGKKQAALLEEAMKARGIPLSESDLWVERIHQGDSSFNDEEFKALSPSFQKELYRTAHACSHVALVERMNQLGMKEKPVPPRGATPLSANMDLVEQWIAVRFYLLELRDKKRLLLAEEAPQDLKPFHCNQKDFSRVSGADFVKKTVERLGVKHIDAAETFAVLKPGATSIHLNTDHGIYIQSDQMDIYAEKIKEVDRLVSLEEAYELLDVIEATGFVDIHRSNFMVTADKIYFIDLELGNFQEHANYNFMGKLLCLVKPEDQEALQANINTRIEVCNKTIEETRADREARKEFEKESREIFFCGRGSYEFPIGSIIK